MAHRKVAWWAILRAPGETGRQVGLTQVCECAEGGAREDGCGIYCGPLPQYPPDDRGPTHPGGVQEGGEAAREPTPPYWWEQEVELDLSVEEEEGDVFAG